VRHSFVYPSVMNNALTPTIMINFPLIMINGCIDARSTQHCSQRHDIRKAPMVRRG
jgi:hypothetical protein